MLADRITLAAVAGAHGIGGEVRLKLFAQSLDSLKPHNAVEIDGRSYMLASVRAGGQGAIARVEGVASRDAAEALRGKLLTVDRASLPPLEDGEYYYADIIGLPCVSASGEALGSVVAIDDYGAGDILEIEQSAGTRVMVPFRAPAATLGDAQIVIDPVYIA